MPRTASASPAFLQSVLQVARSSFERRRQPEENSATQGNERCKNKRARVQSHFAGSWESACQNAQRRLRAPARQQQPERPSNQGKQKAFRQQLPHESGLARSQRRPNG